MPIDSPNRRKFITRSACAAAVAAQAIARPTAGAQDAGFPSRPVRFVVPFPAGGTSDVIARLFAQAMSPVLGQAIVIDNKPGAGTTIGAEFAARAPADGYTVIFTTSSPITVAPHFQKVSYRAEQDFDPVALVGDTPMMFVAAAAGSGPKTMKELIEHIRARPGEVSAALTGNGTIGHLAMEMLRYSGKLDFQLVPYKGVSEAYNDLIAGRLTFGVDAPASGMPHVKGGQLRALAVTSAQRINALPDTPTVAASGIPGFDMGFWMGILGPRGLPPAVNRKLAQAAFKAQEDPALARRLADLGVEPRRIDGAQFAQVIHDENEKWARLVKATGATLR